MAVNSYRPKVEPKKLTGEAKEYYERIEDMIDSERYGFAEDTLFSIGEWIEKHNHVTEKQKTAIENIEDSRN